MHDRRECNRSVKNINIRLYQNENFMSLGQTLNLNSSGMFIRADALLFPKGSLLEITIDDPEDRKRYHKTAKIVHRTTRGFGVQFQNTTIRDGDLQFERLLDCSKRPCN